MTKKEYETLCLWLEEGFECRVAVNRATSSANIEIRFIRPLIRDYKEEDDLNCFLLKIPETPEMSKHYTAD